MSTLKEIYRRNRERHLLLIDSVLSGLFGETKEEIIASSVNYNTHLKPIVDEEIKRLEHAIKNRQKESLSKNHFEWKKNNK